MTLHSGGITGIGAGTLQTSAGSSTVSVVPSGSMSIGDLLAITCYCDGDPRSVSDAGDGWVIAASGYDGSSFGIFCAVCIAPKTSGLAGLTLPASMAWTSQSYCWRMSFNPKSIVKLDVSQAKAGGDCYIGASSSTTLNAPIRTPPYAQCIEIQASGYNNGGTTTTQTTRSGYTEVFDTGQVSPAHGVTMDYALSYGSVSYPALNGALAVAKTNRACCVVYVPIVACTIMPNRRLTMLRNG